MAGRGERCLGFGELRMDDQWLFWPEGTRQQGECFCCSGGGKYVINGNAVRRRNGFCRGVSVGIGGEILGRVVDDRTEPVRRCREADIDSQVDQAFGDVAISVVLKIVKRFAQSARVMMDCVRKYMSQLGVAGPVQMQVARVQSLPTDSRWVRREADRLTVGEPCSSN